MLLFEVGMLLLGQMVSLFEHGMFLAGSDVFLSGHDMFLFGNDMFLFGSDMSLFEDDLLLFDHDMFHNVQADKLCNNALDEMIHGLSWIFTQILCTCTGQK